MLLGMSRNIRVPPSVDSPDRSFAITTGSSTSRYSAEGTPTPFAADKRKDNNASSQVRTGGRSRTHGLSQGALSSAAKERARHFSGHRPATAPTQELAPQVSREWEVLADDMPTPTAAQMALLEYKQILNTSSQPKPRLLNVLHNLPSLDKVRERQMIYTSKNPVAYLNNNPSLFFAHTDLFLPKHIDKVIDWLKQNPELAEDHFHEDIQNINLHVNNCHYFTEHRSSAVISMTPSHSPLNWLASSLLTMPAATMTRVLDALPESTRLSPAQIAATQARIALYMCLNPQDYPPNLLQNLTKSTDCFKHIAHATAECFVHNKINYDFGLSNPGLPINSHKLLTKTFAGILSGLSGANGQAFLKDIQHNAPAVFDAEFPAELANAYNNRIRHPDADLLFYHRAITQVGQLMSPANRSVFFAHLDTSLRHLQKS